MRMGEFEITGFNLEGLKVYLRRPERGTIAEVWRLKDGNFYCLCVFKWDKRKRVYRIIDETPEFWELKINENLFNLYIDQLYKDLMLYHAKLDDLKHDKKIIEELYSTIKNEPKKR